MKRLLFLSALLAVLFLPDFAEAGILRARGRACSSSVSSSCGQRTRARTLIVHRARSRCR